MSNITLNNIEAYKGSALVGGGTQGGLYHNGQIYQFGDGGYCAILSADLSPISSFRLPPYGDNTSTYPHCSAVEWIIPGQKVAVTTNATGLVAYADRIYVYDISDTSNITQDIVMLDVTDRNKYARMACMGYDQTNKIMYIAGYSSGAQKNADSACWFESFDMSDYVDNGTLYASRLSQKEGTEKGYHLQDGGFYNGYIYYLCDRDDTTNSSYNGLYIWVLNTNFDTVAVLDVSVGNASEAETFALIPDTNSMTFLSSILKNGVTYYKTKIEKNSVTPSEPALTLQTSVNVTGYTINGVDRSESEIVLTDGTYVVTPILKGDAVWNKWSDDNTTLTRTFNASSTSHQTLKAYAIQETITLVGAPAPIAQSSRGTSVNAAGSAAPMYWIISSNANYPNEYMLVGNGQQNDGDRDITTMNANKFTTNETTYFNEHNITADKYYFASIPDGYTKIKVKLTDGEGETNTPNSRNPNVIFIGGADDTKMVKLYGNTDIYRPTDSSIIGDGFTYDLSAIKVKDGSTKSCSLSTYNFILVRLGGNASRLNNTIATIQFIKD